MKPIEKLRDVMARLRDPGNGCPWDLEQTFETIAPYTVEEAYEVADAIDRGDIGGLRGELGDLLLQVVFHAQMASEAGEFAFEDVARAISDKMERRHPHVFGDESRADADAVQASWEQIKHAERAAAGDDDDSALAGIARGGRPLIALNATRYAREADLRFALVPEPRPVLHRRIERRLQAMLDAGFVDEVLQLRQRPALDERSPAMRAVGYRQIWAYLDGHTTLKDAVHKAIAATRQLAKRQVTWLRTEPGLICLNSLEADVFGAISAQIRQQIG